MRDFIKRAMEQVLRFFKQNIIMSIQIIVIVFFLTGLLSIILQLNSLFTDDNTPYYQRLTMLEIQNQPITEQLTKVMTESDDVESFLPYTNFRNFKWVQPSLANYYVLPSRLYFYDTAYLDEASSLYQGSGKNGIILSADFTNHLISQTRYEDLFGKHKRPSYDLLQKYVRLGIPPEEVNKEMLEHDMIFSVQKDYIDEEAKTFKLPISAQFNSTLNLMPQGGMMVPLQVWGKFSEKTPLKLTQAFVKVKDVDDIPKVLKKLKELGYTVNNDAKIAEMNMESTKQLVRDLLILLIIISLVALINIINLVTSVLRERRQEIALMKALGAKKRHVVGITVLESGVMMTFSTIIGFLLVKSGFTIVQSLIKSGTIAEKFFQSLDLEIVSALSLFEIPFGVYGSVYLVILLLGCIVTYIPAHQMYQTNYTKLMK